MRIPAAAIAAALAFAAATTAQSPLTTLYAQNNGGAAGWTMYFDLTVNVAVSISRVDVNNGGALVAGSVDVYTKTGTFVGFDTNAAAWTLGSNGPCTGAAINTPTVCTLATPIVLGPGNYGIAIVHNGIAPFYTNGTGSTTPGGGPGSNQTYSNMDMTLLAGAAAGGGLGTSICCNPRVFNGSLHYTILAGYASRLSYGTGCYNRPGTFYEDFATAGAFDLGNTNISMVFSGTSYVVRPGLTTYVAPSGTATVIANGDDVQQAVALGSPLNHPGGSTTSLMVCSNAYVSTATGNSLSFTPTLAAFLGFSQTCWSNWHDLDPTGTGSGLIKFEEVGNVSYVTWDGVRDYVAAGPTAANANTFQFQFDRSNGNVHMCFQGMSTIGGSGFITGFKLGGPVFDPGNRDVSATLLATFPAGRDVPALAVDGSARPVLGTTINLVTTNFPANSGIGANILSFTRHNPGIDLTPLGMPGCRQFTGLDSSLVIIPVSGTASRSFGIPNNPAYAGMHVYSMSAAFSAGANPLGVISSNGLDLLVNTL